MCVRMRVLVLKASPCELRSLNGFHNDHIWTGTRYILSLCSIVSVESRDGSGLRDSSTLYSLPQLGLQVASWMQQNQILQTLPAGSAVIVTLGALSMRCILLDVAGADAAGSFQFTRVTKLIHETQALFTIGIARYNDDHR